MTAAVLVLREDLAVFLGFKSENRENRQHGQRLTRTTRNAPILRIYLSHECGRFYLLTHPQSDQ